MPPGLAQRAQGASAALTSGAVRWSAPGACTASIPPQLPPCSFPRDVLRPPPSRTVSFCKTALCSAMSGPLAAAQRRQPAVSAALRALCRAPAPLRWEVSPAPRPSAGGPLSPSALLALCRVLSRWLVILTRPSARPPCWRSAALLR